MRAGFKLLTVLAVASFTAVGCGSDPVTDTDTTGGDTTIGSDTNNDVGTNTDTSETTGSVCGTRQCGIFAGENCGTCGAGLSCTALGKCEIPGQPLGAYCGATATCNSGMPQGTGANQFPGCLDSACESKTCLGNVQGAFLLPEVCSRVCQIYKDSNSDGVNDEDAPQDDCNPTDIVDGPTGDKFRCVTFAEPGSASALNLCVPGSTFVTCSSDADCPSEETCTITNMIDGGSNVGQRCVAKFRENSTWAGTVSDLSESCNSDPATGPISACGSGLCFGIGCVPLCQNDADCDTTAVYPGTGCTDNKCGGNGKACTTDGDCSAWSCDDPRDIFSPESGFPQFKTCWPKDCDVAQDCGKGFYCRFFWNGEIGQDAALENMCLAENPEGVDLGEACDSNPDDNIPGATCKAEDLCIGGYCSALCRSDADCGAADQACGILEFPIDADDPADDVYDAVLAFGACQTYPDATGSCLKNSDCAANFQCELYAINNPTASAVADGPYLLNGVCVPVDQVKFPGTTGDYGTLCQSSAECKSGYCLGASAQSAGICSTLCEASSDCADITLDGEVYQGLCNSYLYGWGGNLDDPRVNYNLNLCVPTSDPMTDCSNGFTCAAGEACFPNVISWDPATPSVVEFFCASITTEGDPAPTKAVGEACNPSAEVGECLSGICFGANGSETVGYCTALCTEATVCGAGTSCIEVTRAARRGQYAGNAATYGLCLQDPICDPCYGHDTCPGDFVCVKTGVVNTANEDDGYRCAPACETTCAGGVTCNEAVDQLGDTLNGCFEKTTTANPVPVVSCPAVP